jgi:hypothetical protein
MSILAAAFSTELGFWGLCRLEEQTRLFLSHFGLFASLLTFQSSKNGARCDMVAV